MLSEYTKKRVSIVLLFFCFSTSVLYSYILSFSERGLPFLDWFNISLYIIWFGILAWIAWNIHRDKPRAKDVVLFFSCLVILLTGFDLYEKDGSLLLAGISLIEASFLFSVYVLLKQE